MLKIVHIQSACSRCVSSVNTARDHHMPSGVIATVLPVAQTWQQIVCAADDTRKHVSRSALQYSTSQAARNIYRFDWTCKGVLGQALKNHRATVALQLA